MNSGLIASRYAAAFYEFVDKHSVVDKAYKQACDLLTAMNGVPKFQQAFRETELVLLEKRESLLRAAVSPEELASEFIDLLRLMERNGRSHFYQMTLTDFTILYRQKHNIIKVDVTVANENVDIAPILQRLMKEGFGATAEISRKVNPEIIGGFIYEDWGHQLDASIKGYLNRALNGLKEKNNRLV